MHNHEILKGLTEAAANHQSALLPSTTGPSPPHLVALLVRDPVGAAAHAVFLPPASGEATSPGVSA
jgi:hypothetical protein